MQKTLARRLLRWTWIVSLAVVAGYLVNVVTAMILENSLIYFPAVYPEGKWNPQGLTIEDAWFQADDGTKLHGWYVPKENAWAAILFATATAAISRIASTPWKCCTGGAACRC